MFISVLPIASILAIALACDPRTATCPPISAMPSSKQYDLSLGNADLQYILPAGITSPSKGSLAFTLNKQGDAPTIVTNDYLLYGNVKATILTAPGVGMVSAFILMSDVLDEVDLEWLGSYNNQVQTNYFYRGITANYDRGGVTPVTTPQNTAHVYEVDWTETTLKWLIDGVVVRTLNKAETSAYGFPSTPSQIKIGVWASGDPTNPAGTIEWGGGLLDYSKAPYTMTLTSLIVKSYTSAKSFSYSSGGASVLISQNAVASNATSGTATSAASTPSTTQLGGAIADIKQNSLSGSSFTAASGTATASRSAAVAASSRPVVTTNSATAAAAAAAAATTVRTSTTPAVSAAQVSGAAVSAARSGTSAAASGTSPAVNTNDSQTVSMSIKLCIVAAMLIFTS